MRTPKKSGSPPKLASKKLPAVDLKTNAVKVKAASSKPKKPATPATRELEAIPGRTRGRFRCEACGACCTNHGDATYVFVNRDEIRRMAEFLKIEETEFRKRFLVAVGRRSSLGARGNACIFLEDNRCLVNPVKPGQCATWPWWEENLEDGKFTEDILFCPGVRRMARELKR